MGRSGDPGWASGSGAAIVMRSIPDPDVRVLGDELAASIVEAIETRAARLATASRSRAISRVDP